MPLKVTTKKKTHDVTIRIDDEPVGLHIKRFTKDDGALFMKDFIRLGRPRGSATENDEQTESRRNEANAFIEHAIVECITVEKGDLLGDDDEPLLTGAELVEAFRFRPDVLSACYQAIFSENCLGKAQKKTLRSLGTFSPGSTPSIPSADGPSPEPTAENAESSSTATTAAVTE